MKIGKQTFIHIPAPHQEVREKEWKAAQNGILTTRGVQPCTLVALYEPGSSTGYLGHFTVTLRQENEGLEDMIETATTRHPYSQFEAWVGGAALIGVSRRGIRRKNEEIYNEMVMTNRDYVAERLRAINSQLTEDWLKQGGRVIDLVFNTSNGTIIYST